MQLTVADKDRRTFPLLLPPVFRRGSRLIDSFLVRASGVSDWTTQRNAREVELLANCSVVGGKMLANYSAADMVANGAVQKCRIQSSCIEIIIIF